MFEKMWELSGEESFVSKCIAVVVTLMTVNHLLGINEVDEFGFLDVIKIACNVVIVYGSYQINKGDSDE